MKKYKVLAALVLCLAMLLMLTGCTTSMTYQRARNLHATGEYAEALKIYQQLGDFADCKEMVGVCYYELGREAMLEEKWQEAIDYFEKSDYHGAPARIEECKNKLAQQ